MADVTWPSISSAVDETLAQLDALHAPLRARRQATSEAMSAMVARLGESSEPWREDDAFTPPPAVRPPGQPAPASPSMPYVPLPERTTHGGPFGPAVRNKLIAEALAKESRW